MASLLDLYVSVKVKDEASKNVETLSGKLGRGLQTAAKIGTAAVAAAATGIVALTKQAATSFAEYEQLAGGAQKIFDQMDTSRILEDAGNAYKNLNMSANEYLAVMNDIGAAFASTMGDEAGYSAAQKGLQAIADYASGTGKSVTELSSKFTMITRSTSSYQSIADQFSGILPATSAAFLEQAQSAGFLEDSYKSLTEVPIAEYQAAVSEMLAKGVEDLGLAGNTAAETANTVSGSLAAVKAQWSNWVTALADDNANLEEQTARLFETIEVAADNLLPVIEQVLSSLGTVLSEKLPELLSQAVAYVIENLPQLIELGGQLVLALISGIEQGLGVLLGMIFGWLDQTIVQPVHNVIDQIMAAFSEFGAAASESFSSTFENIKTLVSEKLEAARATVQSIIERIRALFDFEWSLPKLKLPHLTISGSFSLNPPSVPHFGLEWYANGAILTQPTMFGFNPFTGNGMIGGEAGAEAIAPISTLQDYISEAVDGGSLPVLQQILGILADMANGNLPIEIVINNVTELDGEVIARKTYVYNVRQERMHGTKLIQS